MTEEYLYVLDENGNKRLHPDIERLREAAYEEGYSDAENSMAAYNLDVIAELREQLRQAKAAKSPAIKLSPLYSVPTGLVTDEVIKYKGPSA